MIFSLGMPNLAYAENDIPDVSNTQCTKTEGCLLAQDHEGECQIDTPSEPTCIQSENCIDGIHDQNCPLYEQPENNENEQGQEQTPIQDFSYSVQYYARINTLVTTGSNDNYSLDVIDTTGKNLPQNHDENNTDVTTKKLYLNEDGTLKTKTKLLPLYNSSNFSFGNHNSINGIDKVSSANTNYTLKELWVLKAGADAESTDESAWIVYTNLAEINFTNNPETADANTNYILLDSNSVLRMVYEPTESIFTNGAAFFDYDITNGKVYTDGEFGTEADRNAENLYANTNKQGINNPENYSDNGEDDDKAHLAFGNTNTGNNWDNKDDLKETISNGTHPYPINQYNYEGYEGCSFGLVNALNNDNLPVFVPDIVAPDLFGTTDATGKTAINDWQLDFNRVGDTYTLSAVTTNDGNKAVENLDSFSHPGEYSIWTNHFWPMDSSATYNADGHDLAFGNTDKEDNRKYGNGEYDVFPVSDDGLDHNSYFGMSYAVQFTLDKEYSGPLEYLFFGDDDMWVFLDGELVCDIGGVHSSVGEYVNLWDYIDKSELEDGPKTYTLRFFYTERGASGSTCFMQFTLPSVSQVTPQSNNGSLKLTKEVIGSKTDQGFNFQITLTDSNDQPLKNLYPYTIYNADNVAIKTSSVENSIANITLKNGEYAVINNLPVGTKYAITETNADGFSAEITNNGIGTIDQAQEYAVTCTNTRDTGNLTVSKTVAGNAGDTNKDFNFTVTLSDTNINDTYGDVTFENGVANFTLKHNESKTVSGLPTGINYTVTEENALGYVTTQTGDTGTIIKDETKTATFINTKNVTPKPQKGNLVISKTVTGDNIDNNQVFNFTINLDNQNINGKYGDLTFVNGTADFELTNGQSITVSDLPKGIGYTAVEKEANSNGYVTTSTNETGKIKANETITVSFVNDKTETIIPDDPQEKPTDKPTNPDNNTPPTPVDKTPKTGDNTNYGIWLAILATAIIGSIYMIKTLKKHKPQNNNQ